MDLLNEFCDKIKNNTLNKDSLNKKYEQNVVHLDAYEQNAALQQKEMECWCTLYGDPPRLHGLFCNRTWDNLMCWDDTPAGTTAYQLCPSYINNFRPNELASRTCMSNGSWSVHPTLHSTKSLGWTNFSACASNNTIQQLQNTHQVPYIFERNAQAMRLMYNVGYSLSLVSLLVAVSIMIYFKRLHCSRNIIHLNLFASFIFRAMVSLIRDNIIVYGLGFRKDVIFNNTRGIVSFSEGNHWECRMFFSVFQYVLAASYIWIFVEAMYLHTYISIAVFVDNLKAQWFILFGWTFPLTFVLPWCLARYLLDNTLCWNTHNHEPGLVWIIQGPIMLTIVLSFICFLSIIRLLCTKLRSPLCPVSSRARYRRLARSTFFLVPTFGVYYILFTVPYSNLSETMEFVMLFIEMFFNSFQGFFIAFVLCFFNTEVRVEIKKACQKWECSCCTNAQSLRGKLNSKTTYTQSLSYMTKAYSKYNTEEMELEVSRNGQLYESGVSKMDSLSPLIQLAVTDKSW